MLFAPGLTCFGCNWSIALWALGAVLLDDFNWTSGAVLVHQNGIGGSIGRLGGGGRYMGDPTETETDDARYSRHAHSHYRVDPAHSDKKILCGHRLVDHMRYICQGPSVGPHRKYGHGHRKRHADGESGRDTFEESAKNENIVNECCKKSCSPSQLRKYCGLYAPTMTAQTSMAAPDLPQAEVRTEILVQEEEEPPELPAMPTPPLNAKGDEGLSSLPFMLQLQDWYGSPRSSSSSAPARSRYVNFVPDYTTPTFRRRPIFNANERRLRRISFWQQGKAVSNREVNPPFQEAAPASDETARDFISSEERTQEGTRWSPTVLVPKYTSGWRTEEGPVSFPMGFSDQLQTYYPKA